jgi:predicted nucleic acid-binding protein
VASPSDPVTAFIDTNVIIRHLTGDPPDMAARATAFLADTDELLLSDLIVAETVYVLESFYEVPRARVVQLIRSVVGFPTMRILDPALLLRSLEIYEVHGVDFAEAYLAASAETTGIRQVASFDRSLDRVPTITRIEP